MLPPIRARLTTWDRFGAGLFPCPVASQTLTTVISLPQSIRRSSGLEVSTVVGLSEARAVAATIASRAYVWPCKPAVASSLLACRATASSGGSALTRDTA